MSYPRALSRLRAIAAIQAAQTAILEASEEASVADLVVALLKPLCGQQQHEALLSVVLVLAELIRLTEPEEMQPLLFLAVTDLLGSVLAEGVVRKGLGEPAATLHACR